MSKEFWLQFFFEAGLDELYATKYAENFMAHKLMERDIKYLDKEYLNSMGIYLCGHIIRILESVGNRRDTAEMLNGNYQSPNQGRKKNSSSDWLCPNPECSRRNFPWRQECFRCQVMKPQSRGRIDSFSYGGSSGVRSRWREHHLQRPQPDAPVQGSSSQRVPRYPSASEVQQSRATQPNKYIPFRTTGVNKSELGKNVENHSSVPLQEQKNVFSSRVMSPEESLMSTKKCPPELPSVQYLRYRAGTMRLEMAAEMKVIKQRKPIPIFSGKGCLRKKTLEGRREFNFDSLAKKDAELSKKVVFKLGGPEVIEIPPGIRKMPLRMSLLDRGRCFSLMTPEEVQALVKSAKMKNPGKDKWTRELSEQDKEY